MKKFFIFLGICFLGLGGIFYYSNEWIKVEKVDIAIKNLPSNFDGFTILQLGDLHSKSFGKNQSNLIKKIKSQNFDVIAITGDMKDDEVEHIDEFLSLIDHLEIEVPILYVLGNSDSADFNELLEERGITVLTEPYLVERDEQFIWFDYYTRFEMVDFADEKDVVIGITHYPEPSDNGYDLILAGHYHGGQIRIPFYGALFVPNTMPYGKCFFPNQDEVKGLQSYGNYQQYITAGLGASKQFKGLKFRLFNPPEINLLTLRREVNGEDL